MLNLHLILEKNGIEKIMGVDYYTCANCERTFPDCSYYFTCANCEYSFCSDACGKKESMPEGIDDPDEDMTTCVLCRNESATDSQLLTALLEHYKISYDDAMKIYKNRAE